MVFYPPSWVPKLEQSPPDSIPISEFMLDDKHGRHPSDKSMNPFTCGISGRTYTHKEMVNRVDLLARALSKELGWQPNQGSEWDKVAGIFALNTVDSMTLAYAVHRLGGLASPANAAYSASELQYQLESSGSKCLFTCIPLLETSLQAAKACGIPNDRVYVLEMPKQFSGTKKLPFKTVSRMIEQGSKLPELEKLKWEKGQGAKQTAYLCYSSGTSGLPKGVMISHQNVIANVMQITAFEAPTRAKRSEGSAEVALGLLPLSHIYGLVVIAQASTYRGDEVIILPKFELESYLNAIQRFKIRTLYLVPPIIIQMTKNQGICKKFDQSSVQSVFTGAAPLGAETAEDLQKIYPSWRIRQGYGLTETCTVVCSSPEHDIFFGSSGSLLPGYSAKIMSIEGNEITGYDQPGELVVQSPSVVLGYLNNDKANTETFLDDIDGKGRWMRTGDEAVIRKNPKSGNEHVFIVDRIKELIKVKGLQVAPAELEAHLLTHPSVADCAVIPVPDDAAGEVPKAFVVKSSSVGLEDNDRMVQRDIIKHVQDHKSRHKWLKGGVEFLDVIPKSPSGKILRRLLRDKEKEARRQKGAKL